MSPSQKRSTVQPSSSRAFVFRESRSTFPLIFAVQYEALCPASSRFSRACRSRPCQKSPSQNTAIRYRENTISGRPGRSLRFVVNRTPSRRNARRRRSSLWVPFLLDVPRAAAEAGGDEGSSPRNEGVRRRAIRVRCDYEAYLRFRIVSILIRHHRDTRASSPTSRPPAPRRP